MSLFFRLFGLVNVANGLWMLAAPASWYHGLPAEVPDTGPLNVHFVRDIGAAFTTIGVALWLAAPAARRHVGVLRATALFYGLHALVHVSDLCAGRLAAGHWLVDFPGVFLPAIVLGVLSLPRWWEA
ncbi:MAG: DUF4345 domain-containing protein [Deltaproteobacteria bacterium]|nr:MAG: DUF4345 domain-containing protein [Deltaproteobacteria bacterium]